MPRDAEEIPFRKVEGEMHWQEDPDSGARTGRSRLASAGTQRPKGAGRRSWSCWLSTVLAEWPRRWLRGQSLRERPAIWSGDHRQRNRRLEPHWAMRPESTSQDLRTSSSRAPFLCGATMRKSRQAQVRTRRLSQGVWQHHFLIGSAVDLSRQRKPRSFPDQTERDTPSQARP